MTATAAHSYSLTRRLLLFLILPLLAVLVVAGGATVLRAQSEVNQLHDRFLSRSANVFTAFLQYEFEEEFTGEDDEDDDEDDEGENEDQDDITEELLEAVAHIERQQDVSADFRLSVSGQVVFTSEVVSKLPACGEGFSTVSAASGTKGSGLDWRCFGRTHSVPESGQYYVAEFFELQAERSQSIVSVLRSALLPLIAIPFLMFVVAWWSIRRGMEDVASVSVEVERRSLGNLEYITIDNRPVELLPVLESVNALMGKVKTGINREKQFTDDAAHELRTPLTSISMTEQLLRRENTCEDIVPLLDQLRNAVGQSQELINQLLRFARLQSNDELDRTELDIVELVHEQLDAHSPTILEKNLSIDIDQCGAVLLSVDRASMSLAIGNLINNAAKFSPTNGTIKLHITSSALTIEDEGIGVAIDDREKIFSRFYRARQVRNTPGTGLGLALVKWVVELHGFIVRCIEPEVLSGAAMSIVWCDEKDNT